jgi:hypothetical protein
MPPKFKLIESEIKRRHVKFPHYTREEIWDIIKSDGDWVKDMEMSIKIHEDLDNRPIDYSNLYTHKGIVYDVSTMRPRDVIKLSLEVDDIEHFESLEHIRSIYIGTAPTTKLYYPEPFIASPSFIHNDLGFLHILQYQY